MPGALAGSRTDCHQVGARHVGGQEQRGRGCRALPGTGSARQSQGTGRHRRCPSEPAGSTQGPARGQNGGAGADPRAGGPSPRWGPSLGHTGRRCPARAFWHRGLHPRCRRPWLWWAGQAAGKRAAEAEAWPLLLLTGTGGGGQALGRRQGAREQQGTGVAGRAPGCAQGGSAEGATAQAWLRPRGQSCPCATGPAAAITGGARALPPAAAACPGQGRWLPAQSQQAPGSRCHPTQGPGVRGGHGAVRDGARRGRRQAEDGAGRAVPGRPGWG